MNMSIKPNTTIDDIAEVPNETTIAAMSLSEQGKDLHEPYETVAKMMEDLNAE